MNSTHIFTAPSGVEFEVTEFLGKHQSMLSRQDKTHLAEKLNNVIKDVTVRIGSVTDRKELDEIIDKMLTCDKKKLLVEVRQFSLDFPEKFDFEYSYIDADNKEAVYVLELDLTQAFKVTPLKKQYKEYKDIEREVTTTLSGNKEVTWNMMDNRDETKSMKIKREDLSSHTPIALRNPKIQLPTTKAKLDLDNLGLRDIETLRKAIKENEGQVDTEFRFEHPEAQYKPESEKYVIGDLIGSVAFFFPSGAI